VSSFDEENALEKWMHEKAADLRRRTGEGEDLVRAALDSFEITQLIEAFGDAVWLDARDA